MYNSTIVHETLNRQENAIEEFDEFKSKVAAADGELIPLRRKLRTGESLHLSVREDTRTIYRYAGFNLREVECVQPLILIGAFADGRKPIGHLDLYIDGSVARGSISMRRFAHAETTWHKAADALWTEQGGDGLRVLEDYRGQGIGSLLFATGAVVVQDRAAMLDTGFLTEAAKMTYRGFGFEGGIHFVCSTDALAGHPKVDEVLRRFVIN